MGVSTNLLGKGVDKMESVILVRTHDGVLHESERDAKRHLDSKYADLLFRFYFGITCQLTKEKSLEYIDNNLDFLQQLKTIKDDMVLHDEELPWN